MKKRKPNIDTALVRLVAVLADADPRTVKNIIAGGRAKGMVDRRVREVLRVHGIDPATEITAESVQSLRNAVGVR